ncbi:nucleolar complex protein 3 homolog [Sycon ciliatum]|uniref:nucleolar complex protein 3 homolog n=1 Tax=Sycon ciliatum TaxID=27933 RepID=UPI0020ABBAF5|eukprot:scpid61430/ scgid15700/ Nucleolar complex protein 3 homolog; NOC3-like protein; Nucleolar complex-associated protein 3-like protein
MKRSKPLLPVKSASGWEYRTAAVSQEDEEEEEEEETLSEDGESTIVPTVSESTPSETYIQRVARGQKTLAAKKAEIASICCSIVQNPSEHYSKLKFLRNLCSETDHRCAVNVRRFALISAANVFKDIAPGYYIRELTAEEKSVKVAKDTRELRDFEQGLVSNYTHYVGLLERYVQAVVGPKNASYSSLKMLSDGQEINEAGLELLAVTATKCMCTLLSNLHHFNCSKQLVHAIVPRLDSKQCNGELAEVCVGMLKDMFKQRGASEITVEAVKTINQIAKTRRDGRLGTNFVEVLLCFRVGDLAEGSAAAITARNEDKQREKEARSRLSRKEKKNLKAAKKLDREMLEAQATESRDKRVRLQTEMLKLLFSVFFRILKRAPHQHLLPFVLEGLAKYAHLISVDFFVDLFKALDSILAMPSLTTRQRLHCVQTAFKVLSGQGEALTIDPRQFYCHLYQCLVELCSTDGQVEVPLATECLEMMLRKRRQVSVQRVLGFVKRLATVSLHQDAPVASVALLDEVRAFMRLYSCVGGLLDSDIVTSGVFQPEVSDPEFSHANCTSLWELSLLGQHYDGNVRKSATQLASGS